jgi:hypothetical protein
VFAKARCRSRALRDAALVVCVETASRERDSLDFVLAGFTTRP